MSRIWLTIAAVSMLVVSCVKPMVHEYVTEDYTPSDAAVTDGVFEQISGEGGTDFGSDCVPQCEGKECGDDGCGGNCGQCGDDGACSDKFECICKNEKCGSTCCAEGGVCHEDTCCTTACEGKECGDDGCGGSCGECADEGQVCGETGSCECEFEACTTGCCAQGELCCQDQCCVADCENRVCGYDDCCGSCGECADNYKCIEDAQSAVCEAECEKLCAQKGCGTAGLEDECTCGPNDGICDDGNPCTDDVCNDEQLCISEANTQECDDGNPCTTNDICSEEVCGGELLPLEELVELDCICALDEDCDSVENNNLCDGTLYCDKAAEEDVSGVCVVDQATILVCVDLHDCTDDSCDPIEGCIFAPDNVKCDDEDPCTDDICSPELGCVQTNNEAPCVNADLCTEDDICSEGECLDGPDVVCDDTVECTDNTCNPELGCVFLANDENCDDENPCTDDSCNAATGCVEVANDLECDDLDPCTVSDVCTSGACAGEPKNCSDDLFCTGVEPCEAETGDCLEGTPPELNDDVDCTVDACDEDLDAVTHTPDHDFCNDNNQCTVDECDPETKCLNTLLTDVECEDGDPCTVGDNCVQGECVPGGVEIACLDYDHDGLANQEDPCIYAFDAGNLDLDQDGEPDACEPLEDNFNYSRDLLLSQAGQPSTWRRTNEPVEIPLTNGLLDRSVLGVFRFDDATIAFDSSQEGDDGDEIAILNGGEAVTGAFGDYNGALHFNGDDYVLFPFAQFASQGNFCLWLKFPNQETFSFGTRMEDEGGISMIWSPDQDAKRFHFRIGTEPGHVLQGYTQESLGDMDNGEWHHYCVGFDTQELELSFFYDGRQMSTIYELKGSSELEDFLFTDWYLGAHWDASTQTLDAKFIGDIDEVLVSGLGIGADGIKRYYESGAPYGTRMLHGSVQHDLDDLRLVEIPKEGEEGNSFVKQVQLVGVRPHSDSPCPPDADPATFGDRDDMCGVMAFWPFDGNYDDMGPHGLHGTASNGNTTTGRFGKEPMQAAQVYGHDDVISIEIPDGDIFGVEGGWEFWALPWQCGDYDRTLLWYGKPDGLQSAFYIDADCMLVGGIYFAGVPWSVTVSDHKIVPGEWIHLAWMRGFGEARTFVNGQIIAAVPDDGGINLEDGTILLGGWPDKEEAFIGLFDEFIFHDAAKTPDYLYNRANPGVPTLRFLANSVVENQGTPEEPSFPMRDYRLYWGNDEADMVPAIIGGPDEGEGDPEVCYGLLNGCLGYAGWWRFDDADGLKVRDASAFGHHGEIEGVEEATYVTNDDATALRFNGESTAVKVPDAPRLQLDRFTLEARISQESDGSDDYLFFRGAPDLVATNYVLTVDADGAAGVSFIPIDLDSISVNSSAAVTPHQYNRVTGTYDQENLRVYLGDKLTGSIATSVMISGMVEPLFVGGRFDGDGMTDHFKGDLDFARLMDRALFPDEFLHFPPAQGRFGTFLDGDGNTVDSDGDDVPDDGDGSGIMGDNPCMGGQTENCDDNAVDVHNPDQEDADSDGVGTVVDNCPEIANSDQANWDGDGLGDACDDLPVDLDHDGLMDNKDGCPYAFDPQQLDLDENGNADACEKAQDEPFKKARKLKFSKESKMSIQRRTAEPVELPLANGLLDNSVIGYWKLDRDTNDASANGNAGTRVGGEWTDGQFGRAIELDGDDDHLEMDATTMDGLHEYTVSLWFRPQNTMDGAYPRADLYYRRTTNYDCTMQITYELGKLLLEYKNWKSGEISASYAVNISAGQWHHLAYAKTTNNEMLGWLDGQLLTDAEMGGWGNPSPEVLEGLQMHFGQRPDGNYNFAGSMDEIVIFSRALTSEDIALYYASNQPYGTNYVPGAQADFDDVRVIEQLAEDEYGEDYVTRSRVIGPKPHSDTWCPGNYVDMPAEEIPGIRDREDMCGVLAYWPLDGHGGDVTEQHNGEVMGTQTVRGRFGDEEGALHFGAEEYVSAPQVFVGQIQELTMEAWFRLDPESLPGGSEYAQGWRRIFRQSGNYNDFTLRVSMFDSFGADTLKLQYLSGGNGEDWEMLTAALVPVSTFRNGTWHHMAGTFDHGTARLYLDGILLTENFDSGSLGDTIDADLNFTDVRIGRSHYDPGPAEHFPGAIDEVIIHRVAKSSDYFLNRANPAVPKIRFLANTMVKVMEDPATGDPSYPLRDYQLRWGDTDVGMRPPFVSAFQGEEHCYGLLNKCFGYAGWWRFNESGGSTFVDSGMGRYHGRTEADFTRIPGLDGNAVYLDQDVIEVPGSAESFDLKRFTVEATVRVVSGGALVNKGWAGDPENTTYRLDFGNEGTVDSGFEYDEGEVNVSLTSEVGFGANEWGSGQVTYDGASLAVYVNGGEPLSLEEEGTPGANDRDLILGADILDIGVSVNHFEGDVDDIRIMNRGLAPDEFLHLPRLDGKHGGLLGPNGQPLDTDQDGIYDDGDGSGFAGDNPCTGGETEDCDDNAPKVGNGDQADPDGDSIGSVIDNCPDAFNPEQDDWDMDGQGDDCGDAPFDSDHDGIYDHIDSCPYAFDPQELDLNEDGQADACVTPVDNYSFARLFKFEADGGPSAQQRTAEPVELPLLNGLFDSSVIGFWRLDRDIQDASADGNAATRVGGEWIEGHTGDALELDGDDDHIAVDATIMDGLRQFTVMFWFRPVNVMDANQSRVDLHYRLNTDTPVPQGTQVISYENGKLIFNYKHSSTGEKSASHYVDISAGTWHHIAYSKTSDNELIGWLDGALLSDPVVGGWGTPDPGLQDGNGYNMHFGQRPDGAYNFEGAIDEVMIFSRVLTPGEMEAYVQSSRPFGTSIVDGAQADYDDLSMVEHIGEGEFGDDFTTRSRVIGLRPHSDTQCPNPLDNLPAGDIPGIGDREDLCGVLAYWRLDDGNAREVVQGNYDEVIGATAVPGRFGDTYGALRFGSEDYVEVPKAFQGEMQEMTVEAWVRIDHEELPGGSEYEAGYRHVYQQAGGYNNVLMRVDMFDAFGDEVRVHFRCGGNGVDWEFAIQELLPSSIFTHNTWHHLGGVFDHGTSSLYLDGMLVASSEDSGELGDTLNFGMDPVEARIGRGVGDSYEQNFPGAIDEVILHAVAKSPGYFESRAHAGLPALRFLANTYVDGEDGQYGVRQYELRWGNDETVDLPYVSGFEGDEPCYGLLNECAGYVGWWRFNETNTTTALDSTTARRHGILHGDAVRQAGIEGTALLFDGATTYVEVPYDAGLNLLQMTLEAASAITDVAGADKFITKGEYGDGSASNYELVAGSDHALLYYFETDGPPWAVKQENGIFYDAWHSYGAARSVDKAWLFTDGEVLSEYESLTEPGFNGDPLILGDVMMPPPSDSLLNGPMDSVRIMNRALTADELLHYPLLTAATGVFVDHEGNYIDSDGDGILDDGDMSGTAGDHPCKGGETQGCDDNAVDVKNPLQEDGDSDGIGDVMDNCVDVFNPAQDDWDADGQGDDCGDPVVDSDHDGMLDNQDGCPYAWDPMGMDLDGTGLSDACELPPTVIDFDHAQWVQLSQDGAASTQRRTAEPVELPLKNGIIDDSLVGYWKLDGDGEDSSAGGLHGQVNGAQPATGVFGDENGALRFDGASSITLPQVFSGSYTGFTTQAWIKWGDNYNGANATVFMHDAGDNSAGIWTGFDNGQGLAGFVCRPASKWQDVYMQWPTTLEEEKGKWYHVACVFDGAMSYGYINGRLFMSQESNSGGVWDDGDIGYQGTSIGGDYYLGNFVGTADEIVVHSRALTAEEVAVYYASAAPYGTDFVPGAQPDYDDLRMAEYPLESEYGGAYTTRSRVIGPRVHSDTPCPDGYGGLEPWQIPAIGDRDDMCGVQAYWRLDGNGTEVTGQYDGGVNGAQPTAGRFGDGDGAMLFHGGNSIQPPQVLSGQYDELTMEAWIRQEHGFSHPGEFTVIFGQRGHYNWPGIFYSESTITCDYGGDGAAYEFDVTADTSMLNFRREWHHVACVFDHGWGRIYVDGILLAEEMEAGLPGGMVDGGLNFWSFAIANDLSDDTNKRHFPGKIDEVLIHRVAKSPDYVYNRAHPGVPKVRFLSNTITEAQGDGLFPVRDYRLFWGNQDAPMTPPYTTSIQGEMCHGMLNECLGYAGWWRFDEIAGPAAIDSSMNRRHGYYHGSVNWTSGIEGLALLLEGQDSYVEVPHDAGLSLPVFTLEAVASVEFAAGADKFITKGIWGDDNPSNYELVAGSDSALLLAWDYGGDGGTYFSPSIGMAIKYGLWHSYAGTVDALADYSIFVDGEEGVSGGGPGVPLTNEDPLVLGQQLVPQGSALDSGLHGPLDSVRIMNRALTDDELLHHPMLAWEYCGDMDGDGLSDCHDNCPATANSNQGDSDGDGHGDACDGLGKPVPASCADVKALSPGASDGDYTIYPHGVAVRIHCDNMMVEPTEYISLANTGGDFNYAQEGGVGDMKTNYYKYGFNPELLAVDRKNPTFSNSEGMSQFGWEFEAVANSFACNMPAEGHANVNLLGTPFFVLPNQYAHEGHASWGTANYSADNQVVDSWGGGGCGSMGPTDPDWLFLGLMDGVTGDADGDGVDLPEDNCPNLPNADQADADDNGVGDACDCDAGWGCEVDEAVCGGTTCPPIEGYEVYCNAKDKCEYANPDSEGHLKWDVWVYLPPGDFMMGRPDSEEGLPNEQPVVEVSFVDGLLFAKYELAADQYQACVAAGECTDPSDPPTGTLYTVDGGYGSYPQNGVTWDQLRTACSWLGIDGRLPSEAEWEYAATGPVHMKYPWGDGPEPTCEHSVFQEIPGQYGCGTGNAWPVDSKAKGASWSGAYNMIGNIFEFVEDCIHGSHDGAPTDGSAWTEDCEDDRKVLRGNGFGALLAYNTMRVSYRGYDFPDGVSDGYGGRCARPVPSPSCGGAECPELEGYHVGCNEQSMCEYTNKYPVDHLKWDVWIYVPPGNFSMGSVMDEPGHQDNESPVHDVSIDYGYFISKYEVVVEQYEACMEEAPDSCTEPSGVDGWSGNESLNTSAKDKDNHPQNGLTFEQAENFCSWTTPGGRLPGEAEWEYAAAGPTHRKYPWGDAPEPTCDNDLAAYSPCYTSGNGCNCTTDVESMPGGKSWCGAMHMGGNVAEWCADWMHDSYDGAPSDGSVWLDPPGTTRVIRGGSFSHQLPTGIRTSWRFGLEPDQRDATQGARCVRPLSDDPDPGDCDPLCVNNVGDPKECGWDGCYGMCGGCDEGSGCSAMGHCVWQNLTCREYQDCTAICATNNPDDPQPCLDICASVTSQETLEQHSNWIQCLFDHGVQDCGEDQECQVQIMVEHCPNQTWDCNGYCGDGQCENWWAEDCVRCADDCEC